jgi:hypothetical protein
MLISFDIGIKNLSYCILDREKETNIYDWNVLNLTNETIHYCCNCKRKACLTLNNNTFYCKAHAKTYSVIDDSYYKFIKYKNPSKKTITNFIKKLNLPIDINSEKNDVCDYIKEHFLISISKLSADDIDLITIGCNLSKILSLTLPLDKITQVIIENQISPIASRMKTLQGMLAQYFIDREINNIKFVSSSNKLKIFNLKKLSYTERKKASIDITNSILERKEYKYSMDNNYNNDTSINNYYNNILIHDNIKWLSFFNQHKKKDDLADCFLQGIWFLGSMATINCE